MYGAIIGDIAGSRFEFDNHRSKEFEIFHPDSFFTDDSVMSLALGMALLDRGDLAHNAVKWMQQLGRDYPGRGYGGSFGVWLLQEDPQPYNSFGNGAAMRVSAAAALSRSLEEALEKSDIITAVTHNHPEGIKGARAVTEAIFLARQGASKEKIRKAMEKYYDLDFTIDEIRPDYFFNETCQDTVPQAIEAFLESEDFEDAIRTAVSVGGDSDTLAAITGSIAEAFYGIDPEMIREARKFLDERLISYADQIEQQSAWIRKN